MVAVLGACTVLAGCAGAAAPELTGLPAPLTPPTAVVPTTEPTTEPTTVPTADAAATPGPSTRPRPGVPAPRSAPAVPAPSGRRWTVTITFYASHDNDPPGSTAISHPVVHRSAGGRGTYADPITMASDPREIAVGTRVYDARLALYFVMEDTCASCIEEWEEARTPHIDLWTGDVVGSEILACEEALTPGGPVAVEVDPPPGRPVDTRPLYGASGCRA